LEIGSLSFIHSQTRRSNFQSTSNLNGERGGGFGGASGIRRPADIGAGFCGSGVFDRQNSGAVIAHFPGESSAISALPLYSWAR
jgi:hypothetical protein